MRAPDLSRSTVTGAGCALPFREKSPLGAVAAAKGAVLLGSGRPNRESLRSELLTRLPFCHFFEMIDAILSWLYGPNGAESHDNMLEPGRCRSVAGKGMSVATENSMSVA